MAQYAFYPPSGGGSNPSVGTNGALAPTSSTEVAGVNPGGLLEPLQVDANKALIISPLTTASTINARLEDGAGNPITSQVNGSARALDIGVNVAGVQIDPRQIRALTSSDTVTVVQPTGSNLHVAVDSSALPTGAATESTLSTFSGKSAAAFINSAFDEVDLTYVSTTTNISTAVYKKAGVTVNTLTLSYDGNGRLSSVVKT